MKRLSFKEWLYKCDEEGGSGEMIVVGSFLIPIFSLIIASIASGTIDFGILPIALVIQFLYVLIYYLIDSRIR